MQEEKRILWVDDEVDMLRPHILFLEGRGYRITPVTNGDDAISLVRQESFDAVLLDEQMPGKDGLETLGELQTISPDLAVIMITNIFPAVGKAPRTLCLGLIARPLAPEWRVAGSDRYLSQVEPRGPADEDLTLVARPRPRVHGGVRRSSDGGPARAFRRPGKDRLRGENPGAG